MSRRIVAAWMGHMAIYLAVCFAIGVPLLGWTAIPLPEEEPTEPWF